MEYVTVQGVRVSSIGFGTYPMKGDPCRKACLNALEAGYRHIDTAQMYNNEQPVGEAIEQSPVPREDVFLVTKLLRGNLAPDEVMSSTAESLDRLDVDTVDLLLIHSPSHSVPIPETIGAMNELQRENRVDHIGVSNFSVQQTKQAIEASSTPVVTNQVKYNPYHLQNEILEYCIREDRMLTAYTPVAHGRVSEDETLTEIGQRHGKTPAQVTLRWLIQQRNVSAIPKAASPGHIRDNIDVFDFELDDREMDRIFQLQGGLIDRLRSMLGL